MAKTLTVLQRLRKMEMDEIRHNLNIFLDKIDTLKAETSKLKAQLAYEAEIVAKQDIPSPTFHSFATYTRWKEENNRRIEEGLQPQIEELQQKLVEQFGEMKTYELMERRAQEREQKEREAKQQAAIDEMALQQFVREEGI